MSMETLAYTNSTIPVDLPAPRKAQTSKRKVPEGYLSLEEFGEIFHQKLNAAYANLQGDSKC